jgi:hypothetical protein
MEKEKAITKQGNKSINEGENVKHQGRKRNKQGRKVERPKTRLCNFKITS